MRALLFFLLSLMLAWRADAHELRPAYLELRQSDLETYDVQWRVPARGDGMRLGLYVEFPADCQVSPPNGRFAGEAYVERWQVRRSGGLPGATIHIAGLQETFTDVLARVEQLDGSSQVERLTPASPSFVILASPRRGLIASTYLALGVEHILRGSDHLLFVLALILITRGGWKLVKTVTAFTVSHSITLSLAALGFVHVPQAPVEAIIALSIVFVASEVVQARQGREGLTARAPWIVAFTFGLLHGLGFAGALRELGLPQTHIPTALLFFSAGVELGHFLFVAVVLALIASLRRPLRLLPHAAQLIPPYAIGSLAMFWLLERLTSLPGMR